MIIRIKLVYTSHVIFLLFLFASDEQKVMVLGWKYKKKRNKQNIYISHFLLLKKCRISKKPIVEVRW